MESLQQPLNFEAGLKLCVERLGVKNLKKEQHEAITKFVLEGKDVLLCLPTGYGKSLCYYSIPILSDFLLGKKSPWSLILIVSPLVALMNDQVTFLTTKGLNAISIVVDDSEHQDKIVRGDFHYIFTTPEILLKGKNWANVFQSEFFNERLQGIIIDEAHCVTKWGKDFRKEYGKLVELRGFFRHDVRIMALTATASPTSRKQIMKKLGIKMPHVIVRCPDKPNIYYFVEKKEKEIEQVFQPLVDHILVKRTKADKTIIFCRTYKHCSEIYLYFKDILKENMTEPPGYPDVAQFKIVNMFTACNSSTVKNQILKSFSTPNGRLRVVIATIAFGMGIDCPNIREVIHWGPPGDCESYIQETGRAGRDGQKAYAILYYSSKEISLPYYGTVNDSVLSK